MKTKKISFFICTLSSGGAEHQLSMLANFLTKEDYIVEIVTFGDEPDHYQLSEKIDRIRIAEGKSSWKKAIGIFLYFLRVKSDCIISFTQRANALVLPAMFLRPGKIVIAGERNKTTNPSDLTEKLLFNLLYHRADWIVSNSYAQANYIKQQKPCFSNKIQVITNYTNIDEYKALQIKASNVIKIGIFCRYALQKNYERFLYATALLVGEGFHNFEIHWYGNTQKLGKINPDFERFVRLVSSLRLEKNVFPHNSIKNVSEIMPQYDILCLPSLYEGFSNSLSEYICSGRPVLASNISDNSLMVRNGENGYLFNPQSVKDIAKAFKKIITLSPDDRVVMGEKSRMIAETLFDKDTFTKAYINLIEHKI